MNNDADFFYGLKDALKGYGLLVSSGNKSYLTLNSISKERCRLVGQEFKYVFVKRKKFNDNFLLRNCLERHVKSLLMQYNAYYFQFDKYFTPPVIWSRREKHNQVCRCLTEKLSRRDSSTITNFCTPFFLPLSPSLHNVVNCH